MTCALVGLGGLAGEGTETVKRDARGGVDGSSRGRWAATGRPKLILTPPLVGFVIANGLGRPRMLNDAFERPGFGGGGGGGAAILMRVRERAGAPALLA